MTGKKENNAEVDPSGARASMESIKTDEKTTVSDSSSISVGDSVTPASSSDAELDFSSDADSRIAIAVPQIGGAYDPRPQEDSARRRIAYSLIALLWLVVIAMFGLIAIGVITVADIKEFAVVLGPVVTLVSAATGFYYGTKSTASPT